MTKLLHPESELAVQPHFSLFHTKTIFFPSHNDHHLIKSVLTDAVTELNASSLQWQELAPGPRRAPQAD